MSYRLAHVAMGTSLRSIPYSGDQQVVDCISLNDVNSRYFRRKCPECDVAGFQRKPADRTVRLDGTEVLKLLFDLIVS